MYVYIYIYICDRRDYKYRLQGKPGNDCPAGTEEIKDVETCRKAYNEAIGKTAPFLQEWVGAWNHPPPGCSVTVALHPLRMIRYFNKRRGNNNGKFIKICKHKMYFIYIYIYILYCIYYIY